MPNSKSSSKGKKQDIDQKILQKNKVTLYPRESIAFGEVDQSEEKQVYNNKELRGHIRKLDHELNIARKQHGCDKKYGGNQEKLDKARADWNRARCNLTRSQYNEVETNLSDAYEGLIEVVNSLHWPQKLQFYISSWGLSPIVLGLVGVIFSLIMLNVFKDQLILGMVPYWAIWVASLGASTQILVGVATDYKKDGIITDYRRTWYTVIIFVSLAFGFIAFLLLQTGLVTISQGQFVINPTNVTATVIQNGSTVTTSPTVSSTTTGSLAFPILICFLAGYATEWFISLIGKLTS